MADYFIFMGNIIDFMKTSFTVWGYEFSFWGIFIFVILGSLVFGFIGNLFNG